MIHFLTLKTYSTHVGTWNFHSCFICNWNGNKKYSKYVCHSKIVMKSTLKIWVNQFCTILIWILDIKFLVIKSYMPIIWSAFVLVDYEFGIRLIYVIKSPKDIIDMNIFRGCFIDLRKDKKKKWKTIHSLSIRYVYCTIRTI